MNDIVDEIGTSASFSVVNTSLYLEIDNPLAIYLSFFV